MLKICTFSQRNTTCINIPRTLISIELWSRLLLKKFQFQASERVPDVSGEEFYNCTHLLFLCLDLYGFQDLVGCSHEFLE